MSTIDIRNDEKLVTLLLEAEKKDTDILIDYLTDNGKGRISLSRSVKDLLVTSKENDELDEDSIRLLIREIQLFGGNSFVNLFRRNGVDYVEIVDDVMSRMNLSGAKSSSIEAKERLIISKVFESAWDKMPEDERKKILNDLGIKTIAGVNALEVILPRISLGGLAAFQITALVASSVASMLAGRAIPLVANMGLGRVLGAFAGPIGIALTGIYSAYDLASPAFRVILPCIVQIAWIRMKSTQKFCPKCDVLVDPTMKFCHQCGTNLKGENHE
ncbi:hypothetical protein [Pantoea agglomerans]|uniref:hypothetical protein n=1 Tax=Enterobacter agglomerans TaxID=549 RepID=UPI001F16BB6B|nr:hypothetical protein [Pantoea agglomerans]